MKAHCLIRKDPWYRREAFVNGLRAAGHTVSDREPHDPDKSTLLVIWNRYTGAHAHLADTVERAGGKVIVAENGYLGKDGVSPKFDVHPAGPKPDSYYALSLGWHNDETRYVQGTGQDRFTALGVEVKPYREHGEYILVCPNRSFGVPGRMMHPDWDMQTAMKLKEYTDMPVKIRKHPGNNEPKRSIHEDLSGAHCAVIWSSTCGVHALVEGVPVVCEAPYWICKSASVTLRQLLEGEVELPDRIAALRQMASMQWTCEEIETGEPFRHLLSVAG